MIVSATMLVLIGALLLVRAPGRWPPPENPPRQSEAIDAGALRAGHAVHAPSALARLIREPQNTWSNLAFIVAGALLVGVQRRGLGAASGWALVGVGVGSFLYHASASRTMRHLDVGAMYWLFLMTTLVAIGAAWPRVKSILERWATHALLLTLGCAVLLTLGRNIRVFGFKPFALSWATGAAAGILGLSLCIVAWRAKSWRVAIQVSATLAIFGVALVCQIGDRPGNWFSAPEAAVQAHALWHILSAAAVCSAVFILDRAPHREGRL